jgi:uncharacterized oxidoreductase
MKANSKVLVTGGATGIGLGIVERLLQLKHTVIVCGRRESVLQELSTKHPSVITKQCDLESPAEREALYNWVAAEHADLNVLINNAGIQNWMSVEQDDFFPRAQQEIAINIEAPLHLSSLFVKLPGLDTIMNVTSGLSFAPLSKVAVYSATKAFMHSFTLSLRHLLKGRGIDVIEIVPPALNTDLGGKGIHNAAPPVSGFIDSIFEQLEQGKNQLTYASSDDRAKASAAALEKYFTQLNP